MKRYVAEGLGTFALVFAGTGAIVINEASGGAITHAGIALTFGLVVLAMIYAVGDISGAHLNPAVTIGFFAARRLPGRTVFPYIGSQLVGARREWLVARIVPATSYARNHHAGRFKDAISHSRNCSDRDSDVC